MANAPTEPASIQTILISVRETHDFHIETRFFESPNIYQKIFIKENKFGNRIYLRCDARGGKYVCQNVSYLNRLFSFRIFSVNFSFETLTYFRLISRWTDDLCRFSLISDDGGDFSYIHFSPSVHLSICLSHHFFFRVRNFGGDATSKTTSTFRVICIQSI